MISMRRLKNCIIIGGMNFLSLFLKVKKETIDSNLANNKKAWDKYVSGLKYIENQPQLTDIKYGQETSFFTKKISGGLPLSASFNSCEIIAVQNALIALGVYKNPQIFPYLIASFEKKGAVLKGYFGTAPRCIIKFLKNNKIEIKKLKPDVPNFGKTPVQILMYQNDSKITSGIHTICILSDNGQPHFLNGKPEKNSIPILLLSLSRREP